MPQTVIPYYYISFLNLLFYLPEVKSFPDYLSREIINTRTKTEREKETIKDKTMKVYIERRGEEIWGQEQYKVKQILDE